jgi:hypothetical protein
MDPLHGRTTTPVGPYSCGRLLGHKGVHAHHGHGASALWGRDGTLLMSIQQVRLWTLGALDAEAPAPLDSGAAEILASSIDVEESGEER